MAQSYPVQTTFAAGEVSPKIWGAFDTTGYKNGVRFIVNGLVDPRGPMYKRPGQKFVNQILNKNDAHLAPFHVSNEESYAVVFTDQEIHIFSNEAQGQGPEELINSMFVAGEVGWGQQIGGGTANVEFDNSDPQFSKCTLTPGKGAGETATIWQTLAPIKSSGSYLLEVSGIIRGINSNSGLRIRVGTTGFDSFDLHDSVVFGNQAFNFIPLTLAASTLITVTITALDWASVPDVVTPTELYITSLKFEESMPTPTVLPSPYLANEINEVQYTMEPGGLDLYTVHRNHTPYKLTLTKGTPDSWAYAAVTFTSKPSEWTGTSNPNSVAFFQGRSWWGGPSPILWGSKSGAYEDLTTGSQAADALKYELAWNGGIRWLSGSKGLLIGTELNEFVAQSEGNVLKPGDFEVELQSSFGSTNLPVEIINNETTFISADGRTVRSMWYQWTEEGYLSRDLTFFSDHIIAGRAKDIGFTRNPEPKLWISDSAGQLLGASYYKHANNDPIYGWFRFVAARGAYLGVTGLESKGSSDMWSAVRRYKNGQSFIDIERWKLDDTVYLDSYVTRRYNGGTTKVDGLDRFEGETVQVVVDGAIHPDAFVSGGEIDLNVTGWVIHVGYGYDFIGTLLPLVQLGELNSTAPFTKRRNKIFVKLWASAMPLVNGDRPPDRSPSTPMNVVEPMTTSDIQVASLGWDKEGTVEIIQDLAQPCYVLGVYSQSDQEIPR